MKLDWISHRPRSLMIKYYAIKTTVLLIAIANLKHKKWVTFQLTFKTKSPPTLCKGLVQSVPEVVGGSTVWKIWSLTTWMNDFEPCPEDEKRLRKPTIPLPANCNINTDVLIIGGGNWQV